MVPGGEVHVVPGFVVRWDLGQSRKRNLLSVLRIRRFLFALAWWVHFFYTNVIRKIKWNSNEKWQRPRQRCRVGTWERHRQAVHTNTMVQQWNQYSAEQTDTLLKNNNLFVYQEWICLLGWILIHENQWHERSLWLHFSSCCRVLVTSFTMCFKSVSSSRRNRPAYLTHTCTVCIANSTGPGLQCQFCLNRWKIVISPGLFGRLTQKRSKEDYGINKYCSTAVLVSSFLSYTWQQGCQLVGLQWSAGILRCWIHRRQPALLGMGSADEERRKEGVSKTQTAHIPWS